MKKIYSLIALFVMMFAAVSVNAQKYSLVQKVDEVAPGTQYAVVNTALNTFMSSKNAADGGSLLEMLVDDDVAWTIEDTGETTPAGFKLYYLYNVGKAAYVQEVDLEGNPGWDGYDVFSYAGFNFEFGDKTNAAKITIEQSSSDTDELEGELWRTHGTASGFVLARQNTVSEGWGEEKCMKFSTQSPNVGWDPYNDNNAWQFWTIRENGAQDKLQILVDRILQEDLAFETGTNPGQFNADVIASFKAKLEEAQVALTTGGKSEEEWNTLFNELDNAYAEAKEAFNPVVEGYYYILSGVPMFEEQQGVKKAMYAASAVKPRWQDFDPAGLSFLWQITKKGEGWAITNVLYDAFLHGSETAALSAKLSMTPKADRTIFIESLGEGQWKIYNDFYNAGYHAESHGGGAGKSGDLVTWNTGANNASAWVLQTVTDQAYIDAVLKERAQQAIKDELKGLIAEAGSLYGQLFVTAADMENPYITMADDNLTGQEGNQLLANRKESSEGTYSSLIDGVIDWHYKADGTEADLATEFNGNFDENGEWAYFHGCWWALEDIGPHSQDAVDFMQVDLSSKPASEFILRIARRFNNGNAQPTQMTVYATNDTTGFYAGTDQWKKITTIYPVPTAPGTGAGKGNIAGEWYSPIIDLGAEYKYVRFTVDATSNGARYMTVSEFQLYPGSVSEELSQYYYVEGMKAAADKMEADRQAASAAYDASETTQAMVDGLRADIAAVKALYATPDELVAAMALAEKELGVATVGEAFGNIADESTIQAYQNALTEASAIDIEGKLDKAVLDAAVKSLNDAKNAMYDAMVVPEAGKWYQITSQENVRETSSYGAYIYSDVTTGKFLWDADEALAESATSMFQFIPVEGETPNVFYIQNMATGLYMGNENVNLSNVTYVSEKPVPYQIAFIGGESVAITSQKDNVNKTGLHAQVAGQSIVGWYYQLSDTPGNEASTWTFQEVEDLEGVVVPLRTNEEFDATTSVLTLPFAVEDLAEINEGITTYAIKNITTDEEGVTTIELYEKDSFAAGEPMVYTTTGVTEILVPAPTTDDLVTKAITANGLVGTLPNSAPLFEGAGYFTINAGEPTVLAAPAGGKLGAAITGYLDIAKFKAAVNAPTAVTITATGLKGSAGGPDVNGDGEVNAADVVSVYNYIISGEESGVTEAAADVNSDGIVNAADVVAIYNAIIGE